MTWKRCFCTMPSMLVKKVQVKQISPFLFCTLMGISSFIVGRAGTIVSCLSAVEAKTFLNANLSFLWGELPDMYSIYIHSIWILGSPSEGRGEVRACRRRGDFVVFSSLGHNLTRSVPLGLEFFCFGVPFIDGSGYWVHGVDAVHEYRI